MKTALNSRSRFNRSRFAVAKREPLGVRCIPVRMDDGAYAVMASGANRAADGVKQAGPFFGSIPFQHLAGDDDTVVLVKRAAPAQTASATAAGQGYIAYSWTGYVLARIDINEYEVGVPDVPTAFIAQHYGSGDRVEGDIVRHLSFPLASDLEPPPSDGRANPDEPAVGAVYGSPFGLGMSLPPTRDEILASLAGGSFAQIVSFIDAAWTDEQGGSTTGLAGYPYTAGGHSYDAYWTYRYRLASGLRYVAT